MCQTVPTGTVLGGKALIKMSDGRGPTVLIVEDIDWIRYGMKRSAERHGYRVVEAANDAEALEVVELESPELILTEEELPTFDALMTRVRTHPAFHNLPVIIINPDADDGARYHAAYVLTDYDRIAPLLASPRE
jgi:CheY-like chemotaxis protein